MADNSQKQHGGKREKAGRPPSKKTLPGGAEFAAAVLGRIKELKLEGIKDKEDYALQLLASKDERIRKEVFIALIWALFGKPAQNVELSGKGGGAVPVQIITNVRLPA